MRNDILSLSTGYSILMLGVCARENTEGTRHLHMRILSAISQFSSRVCWYLEQGHTLRNHSEFASTQEVVLMSLFAFPSLGLCGLHLVTPLCICIFAYCSSDGKGGSPNPLSGPK